MRFALPLALAAYTALLPFTRTQGTLTADARVAVVSDRQGAAFVRPVGRQRWSPVGPKSVLLPGDQVRTSVRGANAVQLGLTGGGSIVLGPGGLVELPKRGAVRLYTGELEVDASADRPIVVTAPGGFESKIDATTTLRAQDGKTRRLADPPRWLTGYKSSTTDEWMGSLIAQVDGRDVPLTVGYHKVSVDVRDQIARTTVEQSFRNTTDATLEGVFYFPLPADASISGFGMWIGGELVEADIVEKQKARRIYEDILRRKKDPGLLEWSGGNLFKARVFPIFPHSEKRVRIRYTQVLPLEGKKVRYRYALRSDLLTKHPLRELAIEVKVSSSAPIRSVSSPTHEVRVRKTTSAASCEFDAQEYSPKRDFELQIELDRVEPLTVVPHRRGPDGYFMLMLAPPGESSSAWQRELTPELGALDVILVADTSGSMDPAARAAQSAFVSSFLSQLGAKDRFRLVASDIEARWHQEEPTPVTEESIHSALDWLDSRQSLGWSDLDEIFDQLAQHVEKDTVVIYVGDGIGTTGDADPVALAQRLALHGKSGKGTFHAVFTSANYEKGVLEAIASLGGGSVRGTSDDPTSAASNLLREAAQPSIKDLRVTFTGLRTARVYPGSLPNLPRGTQQIVLGRFLPNGAEQNGQVVVTGTLDGKPVRYAANVTLRDGESGNSFLPRLWARRHIDTLLAEGRSKAIQDDVVAFSEEFGIMTPYTSFLVLESDEDREKYGVTRRVKMRDGEQFFADGRDRATTELAREQMKLARTWRLDLRRRMLRELGTLGAELHVAVGTSTRRRESARFDRFFAGVRGGRGGPASPPVYGPSSPTGNWAEGRAEAKAGSADAANELAKVVEESESELQDKSVEDDLEALEKNVSREDFDLPGLKGKKRRSYAQARLPAASSLTADFAPSRRGRRSTRRPSSPMPFGNFRFPALGDAPKKPAPYDDPTWPEEALAALRCLDRREALTKLMAGIEVTQQVEALHALTGRATRRSTALGLLGGSQWFVRTQSRDAEPIDHWLIAGKRGALATGLRLGRRRDAAPTDAPCPFPWRNLENTDLVRSYRSWSASSTKDGDVTVVTLRSADGNTVLTMRIDVARRVLLRHVTEVQGKRQSSTEFANHVTVHGIPVAREITRRDDRDRPIERVTLRVNELTADDVRQKMESQIANHADVIFLGATDPKLATAKQAAHEKRAGFAEHFRISLHYAASQQWDRVWEAWQAAEATVATKPGAWWLRAQLFAASRRGEDLKLAAFARVPTILGASGPAAAWLASYLVQLASSKLSADEQLRLVEAIADGWKREGADQAWRTVTWRRKRASLLQSVGRHDEARPIWSALASERPWDVQSVLDHIGALAQQPRLDEAIRVARTSIEKQKWTQSESHRVFERWTQFLWNKRDLAALLAACRAWTTRNPHTEQAWLRQASTQLFLNQVSEVDAWIKGRLAAAIPAKLERPAIAELGAAIQIALGQGWNFYGNRIDEMWWAPLADVARRLMQGEHDQTGLAQRILGHWRYRRTDSYAHLRKELLADLTGGDALETMSVRRLRAYISQISWSRGNVDPKVWRSVTDRVRTRWQTAKADKANSWKRRQLGDLVVRLLDGHGERDEAIGFVRQRLAVASETNRPRIANDLMRRLFLLDWSAELEGEILSLVSKVQPKQIVALDPTANRMQLAANTIRKVAAQLYRKRYEALLGKAADREKLSRAELARKKREARSQARTALAVSFAAQKTKAADYEKPWYELERICLRVRTTDAKQLAASTAEARELLGSTPADRKRHADVLLRERCAIAAAYAATRRDASEALANSTVELLRSLVPDAAPSQNPDLEQPIDWKYHLFRILVALDRPDQLAKTLQAWVVPAKVESRWRVALGYLHAETGKLDQAIAAFEAVAALDELRPKQYTSLANWLLVKGDDARRAKALRGRWLATSESELSQRVYREQRRVSRRGKGVPATFDSETLQALDALLAKSSYPRNYLYQIRRLYKATKDFRILRCLPYGVVGHTQQRIYDFLGRVSTVINSVHEEATCDKLAETIRKLQSDTERTTDRRALLMLQALVERRAAEVLNQPGPHAEKGVDAMRRAFRDTWAVGEHVQMAGFLASLGRIRQRAFAQEQIRQLRWLHDQGKPGTYERLQLARHLYRTLWAHNDRDDAIDGLDAAITEYRGSAEKKLPSNASSTLQMLSGWLIQLRRFARAESLISQELALATPAQRSTLEQQLFRIYVEATRHRGSVSIGRGSRLFDAARRAMETAMFGPNRSQTRNTLSRYCELHKAAGKVGISKAGKELERFAKDRLPELLTVTPSNGSRLVQTVAGALRELRGPARALAFLIERLEKEPTWWARIGQDGWRRHAYSLARWRSEASDIEELEPRLLTLVLTEIERDLTSLQSRYRTIYQNNRYFWSEKRMDFMRVALKVIELHPDSAARQLYAARYLWNGLRMKRRAIDALRAAETRGATREDGRLQLVRWMHDRAIREFGESLPLLEKLVTARPDRLNYRTLQIQALHEVGRNTEAITLLDATEKRFREIKRWNESTIATLANVCRTSEYWERAATYYEEVIPLHQRTRRNRGVGGGTLSNYYGGLAECWVKLGNADKAVDAASAAVVAWGPTHRNRTNALNKLQNVIRNIPKLEEWLATYDAKIAKTGLDAPLIRKTVGKVLLSRREAAKAIPQLIAARELQANDDETHELILKAYDALGKKREACAALLDSIRAAPMKLTLYAELGRRLSDLGDAKGAQRAWTTLVEVKPNEAEPHRMLAEQFGKQTRWPEAVVQWRQVVRCRAEEPTGWLSLAQAQIRAGDKADAKKTLAHVLSQTWEPRFGDVKNKAARLLSETSGSPR